MDCGGDGSNCTTCGAGQAFLGDPCLLDDEAGAGFGGVAQKDEHSDSLVDGLMEGQDVQDGVERSCRVSDASRASRATIATRMRSVQRPSNPTNLNLPLSTRVGPTSVLPSPKLSDVSPGRDTPNSFKQPWHSLQSVRDQVREGLHEPARLAYRQEVEGDEGGSEVVETVGVSVSSLSGSSSGSSLDESIWWFLTVSQSRPFPV